MGFPSRIYLTGFMASGKSTVGPRLAARLGYDFVDMDAMIEAEAGRSIKDIFVDEGEAGFRIRERRVLISLTSRERTVIATGGGAIANEENLSAASSSGCVVFLDVSVETILSRIRSDATPRPLLQGEADPEVKVHKLLSRRRPFYERADLTVDANDADPDAIAAEVIRRVHAGAGTSDDDEATDRARQAPRSARPLDSRRS